jgi:hypothetical protein
MNGFVASVLPNDESTKGIKKAETWRNPCREQSYSHCLFQTRGLGVFFSAFYLISPLFSEIGKNVEFDANRWATVTKSSDGRESFKRKSLNLAAPEKMNYQICFV